MSLQTAPYNEAMRLGSGFNSYTQQQCVDNAVIKDDNTAGGDPDLKTQSPAKREPGPTSQQVSYTSKFVESSSEVTNAMNVSGSLEIKYGGVGVKGSASYVDSSKIKDSDINYFVQVKVVNQQLVAEDVNKFNPIDNVSTTDRKKFTDIYGDSYISGFLEGGEFNALLSVKVKDKSQVNKIKGELSLSLSKVGFGVEGGGSGGNTSSDLHKHAETSIAVAWSGGGKLDTGTFDDKVKKQELETQAPKAPKSTPADAKKPINDGWTIETMARAAFSFADRVREVPKRTHAILTKYTALRSYQLLPEKGSPLDYENAGVYTSSLLESYLDYKSIWNEVKRLGKGNPQGPLKLVDAPASIEDDIKELKSSYGDDPAKLKHLPEVRYKGSVVGLERASNDCRGQMIRIVNEVDAVANDPTVATDLNRAVVYLNPLLFRQLLPVPATPAPALPAPGSPAPGLPGPGLPASELPNRSYVAEGEYHITLDQTTPTWLPKRPQLQGSGYRASQRAWAWSIIPRDENRYMIMDEDLDHSPGSHPPALRTPDRLAEDEHVLFQDTDRDTRDERFMWYIEFHSRPKDMGPKFKIYSVVNPQFALSFSGRDDDQWATMRDARAHETAWQLKTRNGRYQ